MPPHARACLDCAQRRRGFLSRLPSARREQVECVMQRRRLRRGTVLATGGRPPTDVYAIQEGLAKVEAEGPHGHPRIIDLLGAGDLAGVEGAFGRPSPFTVRSLTSTVVCHAPAAEFRRLLDRAGVAAALADHLLCVAQRSGERLLGLGTNTAVERFAAFLVDGPLPADDTNRVRLPLKRREIAALLGITPETVARAIHTLVADGLIEVDRDRVRILDTEGLILRADGEESPAKG